MFEAVAQLLPIVAILYLADGWVRLVPGVQLIAIRASLSRPFFHPGQGVGHWRSGGLRWTATWPWGWAFLVADPVWLPHSEGVWTREVDDRAPGLLWSRECWRFVEWHEIVAIEFDHRKIFLRCSDTEIVLVLPSPAWAASQAEELEELRLVESAARQERIESWWHHRFDVAAVRERSLSLRRLRETLDLSGAAGFVWLFAVLPIGLFTLNSWRAMAALLLITVALLGISAVLLVRAARRMRRQGLHVEGVLLPLFLSPPALCRAGVSLSLHSYADFDPAAVAAHALDPEQRSAILRQRLRLATHAAHSSDEATWGAVWHRRCAALEEVARASGLDTANLMTPPQSEREGAAWCPVCGGSFEQRTVECDDCSLPLLPADSDAAHLQLSPDHG